MSSTVCMMRICRNDLKRDPDVEDPDVIVVIPKGAPENSSLRAWQDLRMGMLVASQVLNIK